MNPQLTSQPESPASNPLQVNGLGTISLKHLAIFNLASFGLFQFYWLYRSAKALYERGNIKVLPELCLIGVLVPALNPIVVFSLFNTISKIAHENEIENMLSPFAATLILLVSNCMLAMNVWQGVTHNEPTHHVALLAASMIFFLVLSTGVLWTQQSILKKL